jgi:hypothetical protein
MKMANERRSVNFDLGFYRLLQRVADAYKQQHKRFMSIAEVIYRLIERDAIICSIYESVKSH